MKIYNKLLLILGLAVVLTACYEKPPAPIDNLIKESLGGVPVAADFQWVSADPDSAGQVSFTFLFWSNEEIAGIEMFSIAGGDTVSVQSNTYAQSGFSATYAADSIAYSFSIPTSLSPGDDLDYLGIVINQNGNGSARSLDFDVNN